MKTLTYQDIIDDKIAAWQNSLKKLEEHAEKASADTQTEIRARMEKFRAAIAAATVQLHALDEQETVSNTMETKDKILEIFDSIDRDFPGYEDLTPFML